MMMMQHTNDRRLGLQQEALDSLQVWYEEEMDRLEEDFRLDSITVSEYKRRARELSRAYDEDYADIFAG